MSFCARFMFNAAVLGAISGPELIKPFLFSTQLRERSGSVVESLVRDRGIKHLATTVIAIAGHTDSMGLTCKPNIYVS